VLKVAAAMKDAGAQSSGAAVPACLLEDMRHLMRDQPLPIPAARLVLPLGKEDVSPAGEGKRRLACRQSSGFCIMEQPDRAQIRAKSVSRSPPGRGVPPL
jgi:hypothetical protein